MLVKLILKCIIATLICLSYTKASLAALQEPEKGVVEFEYSSANIENLVDSNTSLAASELRKFNSQFENLSLKQKLTYQYLLTEIQLSQGQYHLAKKSATDGLSLTLQLSSPSLVITELLYSRGNAYEKIGDIELATKDYESGLTLAESLHDNVLTAKGLVYLAAIYNLTDRYEKSLTILNDAYNIAKQTNDESLKGAVNAELGVLYSNLQRSKQAMVYYQQSYQHYKKANKFALSLNALVNIGINHLSAGQYEQAIVVYNTVIKESEDFGNNQVMYNAYSGLSWANLKRNKPDREASYQFLLRAKKYLEKIEQYDIELKYYVDEAFIMFELQNYEEAIESISRVENILALQMPLGFLKMQMRINIINLKSKTLSKLGFFQKAYDLQQERLSLIQLLNDKKHTQSVAEVRIALEAKEADLQKKVLKNKQALQEISLREAEKKQQKQKQYLLYIAVVALIFAWLLVKLVQGQSKLHKASNIDMLTGVANRKTLMIKGEKLLHKAIAMNTNFSVLIINIDNLKKVNDEFSHKLGDMLIKQVAELGENFMRKTDAFGRLGGEEFAAFLPNTSSLQAKMIAERFRESVATHTWQVDEEFNAFKNLTVSIGIANSIDFNEKELSDLEALINKADSLLYQAKDQGRNKVCI